MAERSRSGQPQPVAPESSDSITDLATRDIVAQEKTTGELAAEFQAVIEKPGAFFWIGVYTDLNPDMNIPTLDVYLAEKVDKSSAEDVQVADAIDAFTDLTLSLRPGTSAHLHLIEEGLIPQLRQQLEGGAENPPTHRLEFEEQIPQAA